MAIISSTLFRCKETLIFYRIIISLILSFLIPTILLSQTLHSEIKFLNSKETLWLKNLEEPLKIGITQIPNQVLKTDRGYSGFSIDLFNEISSQLKSNFQFVYFDTWDQLLVAGERREIDIIFLAQKREERLKLYDFTDVVLKQQNKIISSSNKLLSVKIKELKNRKVAVVKNSAISQYIKLNFPKIILVNSKNELESIKMVENGSAEYTIAEAVRASYYIQKYNIKNLHIVGDIQYDYKLRIASRNDLPIINIILNKAIENMDESKIKSLALKWGYTKDKEIFFDKQMLINILIIGTIILSFLIYLFNLNKKLKRAQKSLIDINITLEERIKIEVEKNRAKELIMLNQSRLAQMGQVLNMVAHQWRQPLNNLLLINEILVYNYEKNQGEITQEEIDKFQKESTLQIRQMSGTIDDFRDFFHPRKEKATFLLNDIIEHLLVIVNPIFMTSKIELTFTEVEDIYINGYSNELAQAILNILYNAKDALIENRDKNRTITINLKEEKEKITLTISDNAGGIPENIILNIFDPYFSTKKNKSGTGIGLYMSKMIIEKHMGGRLKVNNSKDGAVFTIELIKHI